MNTELSEFLILSRKGDGYCEGVFAKETAGMKASSGRDRDTLTVIRLKKYHRC
jgi:hypothetical protein